MAFELVTYKDIRDSIMETANLNKSSSEASNNVLRLINERYVDIAQLTRWRWLQTAGATVVPMVYNTGTVTLTDGSATVVGASVSWASSVVGRKMALLGQNELYTILSRSSATRVILTENFAGTTDSAGEYRIIQDTFTMPATCEEVVDVYHFPPGIGRARTISPISQREMLNFKMRQNAADYFAVSWTHENSTSSGTRKIGVWPGSKTDAPYRLRTEYIRKVTSLAASTDQPLMPVTYRSAIKWGALADIYLQQGNIKRSQWAEQKYQLKINEMKKDWETTDRRIKFVAQNNRFRNRLVTPSNYDLGSAWETDSWRDD